MPCDVVRTVAFSAGHSSRLGWSGIACCAALAVGCGAQPVAQTPGDPGAISSEVGVEPATIVADNPELPADDLTRLDLASLIGSGAITAEHNAGWNNFPRKLTDRDTATFKTTNGVDPVRLKFTFQQPTAVKSVRLFLSGAPEYDWTVDTGSDGPAFGVKGAASERWSRIDLPDGLNTQSLVLELSRAGPDHTMSVHEVELYGPR